MVANNTWSGAAALLLFSFLPTSLQAQGSWSQSPTSGPVQLLGEHAAAYDLVHERTVVFGGFSPGYAMQGGTWEFDGVTWTPLITAIAPSARAGHTMAYDALRGCMVMFGGAATMLASSGLGDTWEHDGSTWTQRLVATMPPARMGHAMCYDLVRSRIVLHGGRANSTILLGDTWEWDGTTWTNAFASGPSPRYSHAMSFDLINACTVLFGGMNSTGALGETWCWNGGTWQQALSPSSPAPRAGHAMAYDLSRSMTVLHGGLPNGTETWEWDGAAWLQHGSTQIGKSGHTMVYDARHQRSTSVGGKSAAHPIFFLSEVETYGHAVPGSYTSSGTSCAGSAATPLLFAPTSVATGPMMGQTSVVQVTNSWFHTFFVFGWSDTYDGSVPLPHDLASYGMPGCSLQVSRDAITSSIPVGGTATSTIQVPNNPFMVSVRFYVQGFSLDLGANMGGFTTTNRLEGIVGRD